MGRSGYSDDLDYGKLELWRRTVENAIGGKRGQRFLCELRDALDAMPEKALVGSDDGELVNQDGDCCALGAVALARGWDDAKAIDSSDHDPLAARLGIAACLVQEIEWENDEDNRSETPERRWQRMRRWVERQIRSAGGEAEKEGSGG